MLNWLCSSTYTHQITDWNGRLQEGADGVFGEELQLMHSYASQNRRTDSGERFFIMCAHKSVTSECKKMIDPGEELSIQKQARTLSVSRSSFYCRPRLVSEADLASMR